ncbi:hypothetical protein CHS0354_028788 [Potamilus streckersoni]|uniref:Uncharacterized protein n=1 Tax=Potamilus streckersoni TaxID=2493646 RepID=A0AAE0S8W7_9BIVA|nr:hypothetical protein CHS0354_028788 [Potamilus streckersoni]
MEKVYTSSDYSSQLLSQMSELWRGNKYCDAVLNLQDERFKLHKLVLMAACPNILRCLAHTEENNVFEFYLPEDVEKSVVRLIVNYLYSGSIQLNMANVYGIEKLAKQLRLSTLSQFCHDFVSLLESETLSQSLLQPGIHKENMPKHESTEVEKVVDPRAVDALNNSAVATLTEINNGNSSLLQLTDGFGQLPLASKSIKTELDASISQPLEEAISRNQEKTITIEPLLVNNILQNIKSDNLITTASAKDSANLDQHLGNDRLESHPVSHQTSSMRTKDPQLNSSTVTSLTPVLSMEACNPSISQTRDKEGDLDLIMTAEDEDFEDLDNEWVPQGDESSNSDYCPESTPDRSKKTKRKMSTKGPKAKRSKKDGPLNAAKKKVRGDKISYDTQAECSPRGQKLKDTLDQRKTTENDKDGAKDISVQHHIQNKNGFQQQSQTERGRAGTLAISIQQQIDDTNSSQKHFEHVETKLGSTFSNYKFLVQRMGEWNCIQPRLECIMQERDREETTDTLLKEKHNEINRSLHHLKHSLTEKGFTDANNTSLHDHLKCMPKERVRKATSNTTLQEQLEYMYKERGGEDASDTSLQEQLDCRHKDRGRDDTSCTSLQKQLEFKHKERDRYDTSVTSLQEQLECRHKERGIDYTIDKSVQEQLECRHKERGIDYTIDKSVQEQLEYRLYERVREDENDTFLPEQLENKYKERVSEYTIKTSLQEQLEYKQKERVKDDTNIIFFHTEDMNALKHDVEVTSLPVTTTRCKICGKVLTKKHNLRRHMAVHNMEKRHRCPVCEKAFARKDVFEKHKVVHTGEKSYQCHLCGKIYSQNAHLQRHVYNSHFPQQSVKTKSTRSHETFQCNICRNTFLLVESLHHHIKSHMEEKFHKFAISQESLIRKDDLKKLIQSYSSPKVFSCRFCGKTFRKLKILVKHEQTHNRNVPFENNTLKSDAVKQENEPEKSVQDGITNEDERQELIESCQDSRMIRMKESSTVLFSATEVEILNQRNDNEQKVEEVTQQCDVCSKVFTRQQNLLRHKMVHELGKRYQCALCLGRFTRKESLERHRVRHTGERPFQCDSCGKSFTQKGHLQRHRKINHPNTIG